MLDGGAILPNGQKVPLSRTDLDPRQNDEVEPGSSIRDALAPRHGVVVGDSYRAQTRGQRGLNDLFRRVRAVPVRLDILRRRGVDVQINCPKRRGTVMRLIAQPVNFRHVRQPFRERPSLDDFACGTCKSCGPASPGYGREGYIAM